MTSWRFMTTMLWMATLSFLLGARFVHAVSSCETAKTPPGVVNITEGNGVTLMDTNRMFITGSNTPCAWTVSCPPTHHLLFQISAQYTFRQKDSTVYSKWELHSTDSTNTLVDTVNWASMDMRLQRVSSAKITFMSKLDQNDRRQYAYVGCVPVPLNAVGAIGNDVQTESFTAFLNENGDKGSRTTGKDTKRIVMIAARGEEGNSFSSYGITEMNLKSFSIGGSGTEVKVFHRDGSFMGTYTNDDDVGSALQSHTVDKDGWGFVLFASSRQQWTLQYCVGSECDTNSALIIGLAVGLGIGIPLLIGGIVLYCCSCCKKKNTNDANDPSNQMAVLTVATTTPVRPRPMPPPRREIENPVGGWHSNNNNVEMHVVKPPPPTKPVAAGSGSHGLYDSSPPLFASGTPSPSPYQANAGHYPTANAFHSTGGVQGVVVEANSQPTASAYNDGRPLTNAQMQQMSSFMEKKNGV